MGIQVSSWIEFDTPKAVLGNMTFYMSSGEENILEDLERVILATIRTAHLEKNKEQLLSCTS